MVSDPARFPGRLLFGSTLRRAFRSLSFLWLPPPTHLGPQRLSQRYPSRLTATELSLWVPLFMGLDPARDFFRPYGRIRRPRRCCRTIRWRFRCALFACQLEERAPAEPATPPSSSLFLAAHWPCPPYVWRVSPHTCASFFSEILELAGKRRLHTTDEDIVLLVRNPTPAHYFLRPEGRATCLLGDELIRIYAPLLMRPWIMQASHSTASCHLGTARTLRMLERFNSLVKISICTLWWLRHCLKCQAW